MGNRKVLAGNKLHALHGGTWLVWNNSGGFASDKIVFKYLHAHIVENFVEPYS